MLEERRNDSRNKAFTIAVCGIHGAGKTSLVARLKEAWLPQAFCLKNTCYDNIRLVEYRHPEYELHEVNPVNAAYTQPYIWAKTLDYLQYYRQAVGPALQSEEMVLSDRWSYCYLALAMTLPDITSYCWRMLKAYPRPDLTILLDAAPEEAYHRIISRGIATPEETIPQLALLRDNYERIFDRLGRDHVYTFHGMSTDEIAEKVHGLVRVMRPADAVNNLSHDPVRKNPLSPV